MNNSDSHRLAAAVTAARVNSPAFPHQLRRRRLLTVPEFPLGGHDSRSTPFLQLSVVLLRLRTTRAYLNSRGAAVSPRSVGGVRKQPWERQS
ncbi:hypothetical protein DL762_008513 [Monosporascus cannonballus]|uniref:Uncharacterized protein n=1 Tax=Monosporascus cannonballus TaxID=155416 RepID=A0ABY0GWL0_9PEZI|nr:hypothetical protein DL762_008513 [Monosporascus cannonballus]